MSLMQNQKGVIAFVALALVVLLTTLGLVALETSNDEISLASNERQEIKGFYAAEAGLEMVASELYHELDSTGLPPKVMPKGQAKHNDHDVVYATFDDGPATMRVLTTGHLTGLYSMSKTYTANAVAINKAEGSTVQLSEQFEVALIPLYQFAVFYFNDLWAQPAFEMTIDGRVHVNGSMYLQNHSGGLGFTDKVTSTGKIIHGFPYGSVPSSDVWFTDAGGDKHSMDESGYWLDNSHHDWHDESMDRWDGRVQDEAHGVEQLNLPLADNSATPHKLIERGTGNPDSYEHKASLKIMDGKPYEQVAGVWVDISSSLPAGTISNTQFYDGHEKKNVNITDIDIQKLKASGRFPANGVIYVSDRRTTYSLNGTRVKNGSDLGKPLTIATENPLYVQGDYNTTNKQPASFLSDALTVLSNSWDDSKSSNSWSSRVPSPTTVNAAFVTGDLEPQHGNYGGGLENLPRFLENWNGKRFKYSGSMIEGWRSKQAKGTWRYTSDPDPYYSAPLRDWSFDVDFKDPHKLPPATPMVRFFNRLGWKQEYVGFAQAETGVKQK